MQRYHYWFASYNNGFVQFEQNQENSQYRKLSCYNHDFLRQSCHSTEILRIGNLSCKSYLIPHTPQKSDFNFHPEMLKLAYTKLGLRLQPPPRKLYCTLPLDLNRQGLERISAARQDWYVTLKADGERAWLVIHGGEASFLFRNLSERRIPEQALPSGIDSKKTTILDGEVVGELFICFDCLILEDKEVFNKPLHLRAEWMKNHLGVWWPTLEMTTPSVKVDTTSEKKESIQRYAIKPILPAVQIHQFYNDEEKLHELKFETKRINCDGLIFMDGQATYLSRSQVLSTLTASMLKHKSLPTVDLACFAEDRGGSLWCCGNQVGSWILCGHMVNPTDPWLHPVLAKGFCILECQHVSKGKWKILKHRTDKSFPNHEKVVLDTIAVIEEGLTSSILITALSPSLSPSSSLSVK